MIGRDKLRDYNFRDGRQLTTVSLNDAFVDLQQRFEEVMSSDGHLAQMEQRFRQATDGVRERAAEVDEAVEREEELQNVPKDTVGPMCPHCNKKYRDAILTSDVMNFAQVTLEHHGTLPMFLSSIFSCTHCGTAFIKQGTHAFARDITFGLAVRKLRQSSARPDDKELKTIFLDLKENGVVGQWVAAFEYICENEDLSIQLKNELKAISSALYDHHSYSYHFPDGESVMFLFPGASHMLFNIELPAMTTGGAGWAVGHDRRTRSTPQSIAGNLLSSPPVMGEALQIRPGHSTPVLVNREEWSLQITDQLIRGIEEGTLLPPIQRNVATLEEYLRRRNFIRNDQSIADWFREYRNANVNVEQWGALETDASVINQFSISRSGNEFPLPDMRNRYAGSYVDVHTPPGN